MEKGRIQKERDAHDFMRFSPSDKLEAGHGRPPGAFERLKMMERRGYRIDRRSGIDRRKIHDLNYFIRGGEERRKFAERRSREERRKNWVRVDEWISVFVDDPVELKRGKSPRRKRLGALVSKVFKVR